jgi:hypothetical protein
MTDDQLADLLGAPPAGELDSRSMCAVAAVHAASRHPGLTRALRAVTTITWAADLTTVATIDWTGLGVIDTSRWSRSDRLFVLAVRSLASDPIASDTPIINLRTLLDGVIPALRQVLADSLEAALRHHAGPNALDIAPDANGEPVPPLPVGPDLPWSVAWATATMFVGCCTTAPPPTGPCLSPYLAS